MIDYYLSQYLKGVNSETFAYEAYLSQFDPRLLACSQGRRALTKLDPLLFALLYFPHHLRSGIHHDGSITMADFHIDMCRRSIWWVDGKSHRHAEVAPRDSGKSTWNFLIRPAWALAHKHRTYVAAFADSGPQAQQHLSTFKNELKENELLRKDFPSLCTPKLRDRGITISDNKNLYISHENQIFMAKGIDASSLGAKQFETRPDLILFDDIEPDASNYSEYQKDKRAHSMISSVLAMNLQAAVVVSGTVTMHGSVVHDLVRTVSDPGGQWTEELRGRPDITEEKFAVHYYPALFDDPTSGEKRSVWPQRWSVRYLESIAHSSAFWLNFMNDPRGREGGWWTQDDFKYGTLGDMATRWILQIDPAVTTKGKSDWTALSVIGYAPPSRQTPVGRVEVAYCRKVKLVGAPLRDLVLRILEYFPRIRGIRVEANQGGEMWIGQYPELPKGQPVPYRLPKEGSALHGVPVPVQIQNSTAPKETRLARGLHWYQRPGNLVVHRERFVSLENTMVSYPNVAFDDEPDCVCLGILYFLEPDKPGKVSALTKAYV